MAQLTIEEKSKAVTDCSKDFESYLNTLGIKLVPYQRKCIKYIMESRDTPVCFPKGRPMRRGFRRS